MRRLRIAPPVQLALAMGDEGSAPAVVWAGMPEEAQAQVLVILARMIAAGVVGETGMEATE